MDDPTLTSITTVVQLINAGGVVAVLIILVGGFWTGKIMSRKTHDEIAEKQTLVVDRFVEKINGSFEMQVKALGRLQECNDGQTVILSDIRSELKQMNTS